jgi:fibronectin-binding autotransporter adhesin
MNRIYRLVWNRALRVLQVASELAASHGGGGTGTGSSSMPKARLPLAIVAVLAAGFLWTALPAAAATCPTNTTSIPSVTGASGTDGADGADASGGNGGTGYGAATSAQLCAASGTTVNGGAGGDGSDGDSGSPSSGPGGNGGYGVAGSGFVLTNEGRIAGGTGGKGGLEILGLIAGDGGHGGAGVYGSNFTLTNDSTVSGGQGGSGGDGALEPGATGSTGGAGGTGVEGTDFKLTNTSAINGGKGGFGGGINVIDDIDAGTGGAGGAGVDGTGFIMANTGTVNGGDGYFGGNVSGPGGHGGTGGAGGAGVTGNRFTLTSANTISGGNGGNGGNSTSAPGGMGGAGGAGVSGTGFTLTNTRTINGGAGGIGGASTGAAGGTGGTGGAGVSGTGFTLTNTHTINGGAGGLGGSGGNGAAGYTGVGIGGVGVAGYDRSTITTSGNISGGLMPDGTHADAIDLGGGGNSLTLESGYSFTGNVVSSSGATNGGDTLALGGDTTPATSFDVSNVVSALPGNPDAGTTYYVGFNQYEKTGTSTWTLTGTGSTSQNWTIKDGTLQGDSQSLVGNIAFAPVTGGHASVVFNQSSLVGGATGVYGGQITGDGAVVVGMVPTATPALQMTGNNSYTGGTTVTHTMLIVGNGHTSGWIVGDVQDDGILVFERSDDVTFNGTISGTGIVAQLGTGVLTLTGDNTYDGSLFTSANPPVPYSTAVENGGTLSISNDDNLGADSGSLGMADGTLETTQPIAMARNIILNGTDVFQTDANLTVSGVISDYRSTLSTGASLTKTGAGALTLDGINTYTDPTTVQAGSLVVGDATHAEAVVGGAVTVDNGATLGGYGKVGGNVMVGKGGVLAPGSSTGFGTAGTFGTFNVGGYLNLQQGSILNVNLGAPGANDTTPGQGDNIDVIGNLSLGGATVNVADVGGMGPGLYNIISYGGTCTGCDASDIVLGSTPANSSLAFQFASGQVNLLDAPAVLNFWDADGKPNGTLGGSGTWTDASTNWSDAGQTSDGAMKPKDGFAVFTGTPGTVTVDDGAGQVEATGMQFAVDGYTLTGGALTLKQDSSGNAPIINVGDGNADSSAYSATIDAVLAGSAGLAKTDYGTLVLAGANTFTGGTTISGGTLAVSQDANLGDASGTLAFDGGTLENTAAFTTARSISVDANGGTFQTDADLTLTGGVTGASMAKTGAATLMLEATSSADWLLNAGTLQVGSSDGGTAGSVTGSMGAHGANNPNGNGDDGDNGDVAVAAGTHTSLNVEQGSFVMGGNGGNGGDSIYGAGGNGGDGGDGGAGVSGSRFTLIDTGGAIAGGIGGDGGNGDTAVSAVTGGNGGHGGAGVSGSHLTLTNDGGRITGGNGGNGGNGSRYPGGAAGAGGAGIVSTGYSSITTTGSIAGGISGLNGAGMNGNGGGEQADAVDFSGGGNTLTLESGYSFTGNVVSSSHVNNGGDTLALGGDTSPAHPFDVSDIVSILPTNPVAGTTYYIGFNQYEKTGASTWTLTGTGAQQDWLLNQGTLQIGSSDGSTPGSITGMGGNLGRPGGTAITAAAGTTLDVMANSSVTGGMGSIGTSEVGPAGNGGHGGAGIASTGGSNISISGSIRGGDGGAGSGGASYVGGAGGAGIASSSGSHVTVNGSIAGGVSGKNGDGSGGGAQADAVDFSGGHSTLTLEVGSSVTGALVGSGITGGDGDALVLGDDTLGSNPQPGGSDSLDVTGLSGFATYTKTGTSTWTLTGSTAAVTPWTIAGGTLVVSRDANLGDASGALAMDGGTLENTAAFSTSRNVTLGANGGTFQTNAGLTESGVISGDGALTKTGTGTLTLNGAANLGKGATAGVQQGTLIVGDGTHAGATLDGNADVADGATLGGFGTVTGASNSVMLAKGGILSPGDGAGSIGTLTVDGNLTAAQGSVLDYDFGAPGANASTFGTGDSVHVGGNLELDGATLNVNDAGGMGPGLYNVFTYAGTCTGCDDSGIVLGSTPANSSLAFQFASGQVNLLDSTGVTLNFWDGGTVADENNGKIDGGSGTWTLATTHLNWTGTDGSMNARWSNDQMAVFTGTPGTVTVDDGAGQVEATGMQFAVDGYTLTGGALTLAKDSSGNAPIINVGDGNADSSTYSATIDAVLTGTAGLTKTDWGTLVLAAQNTYSGGTTVEGGTLEIAPGGSLGTGGNADTGFVTVDDSSNEGATLKVDGGVSLSIQTIILNNGATLSNAGTLNDAVDANAVASVNGVAFVDNHDGGSIDGIDTGVFLADGGDVTNEGVGSRIGASASADDGNGIAVEGAEGTINNTGGASIVGGDTGVWLRDGGSVTNDGAGSSISASADGGNGIAVEGAKGTITNTDGASIVSGDTGVWLSSGGSVTNESADIDGAQVGIAIAGAAGTVKNRKGASIAGGNTGVWLMDGGSVTNDGAHSKIGSTNDGGRGVYVQNAAGTVENTDGASIAGGVAGVELANGGSVTNDGADSSISASADDAKNGSTSVLIIGAAGTVENTDGASIAGGAVGVELGDGGSVTNDGASISGTQAGIIIATAASTVHNTGGASISGAGGIFLAKGGKVVNDADSTIQATGTGHGDCLKGAGSCGIFVATPSSEFPDLGGATTLSNAGRIVGNVRLDPDFANAVTLTAGGSIAGDLDIGSGTAGSAQSTLTLGGDNATPQPYSDAVTGKTLFDGALAKNGSGTWVIDTDDLSSAGGATIKAGTLQVGAGGTAGSIGNGNVADGGTLAFDRSDDVTYGGAISGTGAVIQQGSGTLTLDGDSGAFAGGTRVKTGTLIVGGDGHADATLGGDVAVDGDATLGGLGTLAGNVDVAGGAHLAPGDGIGTLTIGRNLDLAGGSVLDDGFGAPAAAPGTFAHFGNGDSVKVGGTLQLAGTTLNVTDAGGMGPGIYNLFTYASLDTSGCTRDAAGGTGGCLAFGNTPGGSSLRLQYLTAANQINLIDTTGLTLDYWNADGNASATRMGGGSGTWSATAPEWTDVTGSVPNDAMQPRPGFAIFGGAAGTVAVDDSAGAVGATGMQFFTSGYTLKGGTLTLAADGAGNAPVVNVGDGSSASAGTTATIDNAIAGSAGLVKTDYGTLVLDGTSTYTGLTEVQQGTLVVGDDTHAGAAIAGDARVDGGATLRGHGRIGGNVVNDGIVWPGDSLGVLTVGGSYTQHADGALQIDVTPTQASRLQVGGNAHLAGTLDLIYAPGSYAPTTYTLVQAKTLDGRFASTHASGATPTALDATVSYTGTQARLALATPTSPSQPTTPVTVAPHDGALYGNLLRTAALENRQSLASVLDAALSPPSSLCDEAAHAHARSASPSSCRRGLWLQYTGASVRIDGADGLRSSGFHLLGGTDGALGDVFHLGVEAGVDQLDVTDPRDGRGRMQDAHAGLYAFADVGPLVLSATADGMRGSHRMNRDTGIGQADAEPDSRTLSGGLQAAWPVGLAHGWLTPKLGVLYQRQTLDGFHEHLASSNPLAPAYAVTGARSRTTSLQPYAALAFTGAFDTRHVRYVPQLELGYYYDSRGDTPAVHATAQDGTPFVVPAAAVGRGFGSVKASITAAAGPSWNLHLDYRGLFASHLHDNALTIGFTRHF